jgi:hypothetical protein
MEPKKIDLSTLDVKKWANDGAVVQLNHPATGEALDIEVHVVGSDSDAYLEMTRELARRRGQQLKRSRQRMATLEDLERDGIELTVACTTGWKNMVIDGAGDAVFRREREQGLHAVHVDPRAGGRLRQRSRQFFAESRERLREFAAHYHWLNEPVDDGAGKNGKIPRIKKLESAASTGHIEAKRQLEEERIVP